jgi:hypothetical protein
MLTDGDLEEAPGPTLHYLGLAKNRTSADLPPGGCPSDLLVYPILISLEFHVVASRQFPNCPRAMCKRRAGISTGITSCHLGRLPKVEPARDVGCEITQVLYGAEHRRSVALLVVTVFHPGTAYAYRRRPRKIVPNMTSHSARCRVVV